MTEIAPGMMVECIKSEDSYYNNQRFIVSEVKFGNYCEHCKSTNCFGLLLVGLPPVDEFDLDGWSGCCFKSIGGDKEIEKEKFAELKPTMIPEHLIRLARG